MLVCVNGLRFNTRSISFEQMPPGEAWFQQDDCTLVHPVRPQGLSMWGPYTSSTSQKKRSYSVPKKLIWQLLVFCWTTQPRGKAVHHRSHQEWGFVESWAWININQYVQGKAGNSSSHSMFLHSCRGRHRLSDVSCPFPCFRTYVFGGLLVSRATDFTGGHMSRVNLTNSGRSWGRCWFGSCDTLEQAEICADALWANIVLSHFWFVWNLSESRESRACFLLVQEIHSASRFLFVSLGFCPMFDAGSSEIFDLSLLSTEMWLSEKCFYSTIQIDSVKVVFSKETDKCDASSNLHNNQPTINQHECFLYLFMLRMAFMWIYPNLIQPLFNEFKSLQVNSKNKKYKCRKIHGVEKHRLVSTFGRRNAGCFTERENRGSGRRGLNPDPECQSFEGPGSEKVGLLQGNSFSKILVNKMKWLTDAYHKLV